MSTAKRMRVNHTQMSHANPSMALSCPQYTKKSWLLQFNAPPSVLVRAAAAASHRIQVINKKTKCEAILARKWLVATKKTPMYAEPKTIVQTEQKRMYRTRARVPEFGLLWCALYLAVTQADMHSSMMENSKRKPNMTG